MPRADLPNGPAVLRALPEPGRPYTSLRDELVSLGWEWADELQVPPTIPGEPEWVRYRHPAGAELEYDFLPPVGLRTLVARGDPDALAPLRGLPQLRPADLAILLDADDAEPLLRGLLGVEALIWVPLLPRVREVAAGHADPLVRGTAQRVAERLPELAADELGDWQAHGSAMPGESLLLASMTVAERRQVLRWLGTDYRTTTVGTLDALRTGLRDADPEVQVTAAVVAARLVCTELTAEIEAITVPAELRRPAELAGAALRAGVPLDIPQPTDADGVLLLALALPVPDVPPPDRLPPHLVIGDGTRLRLSGVLVALVPAVPHWLSQPGHSPDPVHPVRVEPFIVTAAPIEVATARLAGLAANGADHDPFLADAATAEHLAHQLSALEGVPLQVVTQQRWEAALRGPDGRRWTSGNLLPAKIAMSPWGALAVPGVSERLAGDLAADPADLGRTRNAARHEPLPVRLAARFPL